MPAYNITSDHRKFITFIGYLVNSACTLTLTYKDLSFLPNVVMSPRALHHPIPHVIPAKAKIQRLLFRREPQIPNSPHSSPRDPNRLWRSFSQKASIGNPVSLLLPLQSHLIAIMALITSECFSCLCRFHLPLLISPLFIRGTKGDSLFARTKRNLSS